MLHTPSRKRRKHDKNSREPPLGSIDRANLVSIFCMGVHLFSVWGSVKITLAHFIVEADTKSMKTVLILYFITWRF